MTMHCADLYNNVHVHEDGATSYEQIRGKTYRGELLEFGCQVLHRIPEKPQGGLMQARWVQGTWLGKRWASEEHLIATLDGKVVRAGTVRMIAE